MIPDAEVLRIMKEALIALDVGDFTIKVNIISFLLFLEGFPSVSFSFLLPLLFF